MKYIPGIYPWKRRVIAIGKENLLFFHFEEREKLMVSTVKEGEEVGDRKKKGATFAQDRCLTMTKPLNTFELVLSFKITVSARICIPGMLSLLATCRALLWGFFFLVILCSLLVELW